MSRSRNPAPRGQGAARAKQVTPFMTLMGFAVNELQLTSTCCDLTIVFFFACFYFNVLDGVAS